MIEIQTLKLFPTFFVFICIANGNTDYYCFLGSFILIKVRFDTTVRVTHLILVYDNGAVTRQHMQILPTVGTNHSHCGLCMCTLFKRKQVWTGFSIIGGTSLDHRSYLRYLGDGWVGGDDKMQWWVKESPVVLEESWWVVKAVPCLPFPAGLWRELCSPVRMQVPIHRLYLNSCFNLYSKFLHLDLLFSPSDSFVAFWNIHVVWHIWLFLLSNLQRSKTAENPKVSSFFPHCLPDFNICFTSAPLHISF